MSYELTDDAGDNAALSHENSSEFNDKVNAGKAADVAVVTPNKKSYKKIIVFSLAFLLIGGLTVYLIAKSVMQSFTPAPTQTTARDVKDGVNSPFKSDRVFSPVPPSVASAAAPPMPSSYSKAVTPAGDAATKPVVAPLTLGVAPTARPIAVVPNKKIDFGNPTAPAIPRRVSDADIASASDQALRNHKVPVVSPVAAPSFSLQNLEQSKPATGLAVPVVASVPRMGLQILGGVNEGDKTAEQVARETFRKGNLTNKTTQVVANNFGDRRNLLPRGFRIPCINVEAFSSDKQGEISCNIPRDVYSADGSRVLIPKGSTAQGSSAGNMNFGDTRVAGFYDRIMTPDGQFIDFNAPVGDGMGAVGIEGNVDRHWGLRLGAAYGLAFFKDLSQIEIARLTKAGASVPQNTAGTTDQMVNNVAEKTMKVNDTITIPQGYEVTIFVKQDMWFFSVVAQ